MIAYVVGNAAGFIFPGFAYAHQPEGRAYGDVEAEGHRWTFDDLRSIRMQRIVNNTSLSKKPSIDWMTGKCEWSRIGMERWKEEICTDHSAGPLFLTRGKQYFQQLHLSF